MGSCNRSIYWSDSRKHNSEHRLTIVWDNLSPLSNSTSALFEAQSWNEVLRGNVPTDWYWYHCTPVRIPNNKKVIKLVCLWLSVMEAILPWSYNNTTKWKANKVALVTVTWQVVFGNFFGSFKFDKDWRKNTYV